MLVLDAHNARIADSASSSGNAHSWKINERWGVPKVIMLGARPWRGTSADGASLGSQRPYG